MGETLSAARIGPGALPKMPTAGQVEATRLAITGRYRT